MNPEPYVFLEEQPMTDVTQTETWKYQANLRKAQTTPLPLQVKVPFTRDKMRVFSFAKHQVRQLAIKIGSEEVTISTEGKLPDQTVTVNFGLPWEDRISFLEILFEEYRLSHAAKEFKKLVEQAEYDFVMKIDEVA